MALLRDQSCIHRKYVVVCVECVFISVVEGGLC